jgi:ribosomal protein L14E/L6E/L27E
MKKIYTMIDEKDSYFLIDDSSEKVIEIKKNTLNIDGIELYEKIFKNFNIGDDIKIEKKFEKEDKISASVYNEIAEIIDKIVKNINLIEQV